jgi:hypothetical protein
MSQKANKIKIHNAPNLSPGNDGNNDLKNCYFLPTNVDEQYVFFDPTGVPIVTTPIPAVNGSSFTCNLPGDTLKWTITFRVSGTGPKATANGLWSNEPSQQQTASASNRHTPSLGDDPTGENGTFQAAAGQTLDPEDPDGEDAAHAAKA